MKYYLWTIGCQMNVADSRRIAEGLESLGYGRAERPEEADLAILNSCVVRESAERRVLGRLTSLKPWTKRHPQRVLAVTGCLVEEGSEQKLSQRFPYVDLFTPASHDAPILALAKELADGQEIEVASHLEHPVSAYIPIIAGCDNFCTYCIVPFRRGRERSRGPEAIMREAEGHVARGAREVVLLGQNVDSYGRDLPGRPTLAELLHSLSDVEGLWRIRFLTNHPKDMSQQLITAVAEVGKVCEHLEVPAQAGHDRTLRRMGRGYTVAQYRGLIQRIREKVPGVGLVTDVIVGFPGETEMEFLGTYRLLEEVRFDAVHIAAYSPRPGTKASRLPDDVPPQEKEHRRRALEELQKGIATQINAALLGKAEEVLVEERLKGKWRGRTRTHKIVFFAHGGDWRGKLAQVRITRTSPWSLQGEVAGVY